MLTVYCKNARVNSSDRLSILLGELEKLSWDIVLLSETRTLDTTQLLDNSHKLYSASAGGHASGVAILVASQHVHAVRAIHRISDRVIALDVCLHSRLSRVLAVYLPHSGYSLAETDEVTSKSLLLFAKPNPVICRLLLEAISIRLLTTLLILLSSLIGLPNSIYNFAMTPLSSILIRHGLIVILLLASVRWTIF